MYVIAVLVAGPMDDRAKKAIDELSLTGVEEVVIINGSEGWVRLGEWRPVMEQEASRTEVLRQIKDRRPTREHYLTIDDFRRFAPGLLSPQEAEQLFRMLYETEGPEGSGRLRVRLLPFPGIEIGSFFELMGSGADLAVDAIAGAVEFLGRLFRGLIDHYPAPARP